MVANELNTKEKYGAPERVRTSDLWFRSSIADSASDDKE
jgi:hypothetical protein